MPELVSLVPLVGIAVLFWFLLIRPANRRQKELRQLQSSLSVGDEVMLTSGIYGEVRSLGDDRVDVEVAPGMVISVARGAVGTITTPIITPTTTTPDDEPPAGDGAEPTSEDR